MTLSEVSVHCIRSQIQISSFELDFNYPVQNIYVSLAWAISYELVGAFCFALFGLMPFLGLVLGSKCSCFLCFQPSILVSWVSSTQTKLPNPKHSCFLGLSNFVRVSWAIDGFGLPSEMVVKQHKVDPSKLDSELLLICQKPLSRSQFYSMRYAQICDLLMHTAWTTFVQICSHMPSGSFWRKID